MDGHKISVTVRGEVPHPEGETGTSVVLVVGSGEPNEVYFIRERGKCCCFGGVLRCCGVFLVAVVLLVVAFGCIDVVHTVFACCCGS